MDTDPDAMFDQWLATLDDSDSINFDIIHGHDNQEECARVAFKAALRIVNWPGA